jgi:hypothetical protein
MYILQTLTESKLRKHATERSRLGVWDCLKLKRGLGGIAWKRKRAMPPECQPTFFFASFNAFETELSRPYIHRGQSSDKDEDPGISEYSLEVNWPSIHSTLRPLQLTSFQTVTPESTREYEEEGASQPRSGQLTQSFTP